jgi:hypothetical protein
MVKGKGKTTTMVSFVNDIIEIFLLRSTGGCLHSLSTNQPNLYRR